MQMAVIEAARNVIGVAMQAQKSLTKKRAANALNEFVYHLKEWVQGNHSLKKGLRRQRRDHAPWCL